MQNDKKILITVDVEDWFQVENLKPWIPYETWNHLELRIEKNVHWLLDLFDSIKKIHATFFVLGWIAQRLPGLVREIHARGHEVGSHGLNHRLSNGLSGPLLAEEISGSKKLLEDLTGSRVYGFRAPSFSIDNRVLNKARDAGYFYDSSFNSFAIHRRYGKIDMNHCRPVDIAYRLSDKFYELPVSNLNFLGQYLPWGGGAYFRFIPTIIFILGIRRIFRKYHSYLFYIHPWEVDPHQPRIGTPLSANRFKHYYNQKKTRKNLQKLICSFPDCRFTTCKDYIHGLP